jgi:tripartite-type tricarboxylate transporter receptor subunit TctC
VIIRRPLLHLGILSVLCFVFFTSSATAQEFFKGKVIRIVLGTPPGGGFDVYSRAISRHMGKHTPGNPTFVLEYMPGAGMMIAANYLYNIAKPDGLTIGNWIGLLVLQQVLGTKGIEFDARRFEWLGAPKGDTPVCALTRASGITSVDNWLAAKTPVKLGGIAPGASTSDIPRILKAILNLPIQLVEGYKGTADIRLAADAHEVAGGCWPWESMKVAWNQQLASAAVKVVIQAAAKKHPELLEVPNATDLAKTDEARRLIKTGIIDPAVITQPYSLPPGTPKDRVKLLQDAFMATMKDPDFLSEAKKSNLDINPISAREVEGVVRDFFTLEPTLLGKLKEFLVPKDL